MHINGHPATPNEILDMIFSDSKYVRHTKDSLVLKIPGHRAEYEIPHSEMLTSARTLGWVRQLAEKNWVTTDHIRILVATAEGLGVEIV